MLSHICFNSFPRKCKCYNISHLRSVLTISKFTIFNVFIDQPEISIEGIGRVSSGGTAQFKASINNAVSSEWTNYWEKVKGMTTEKLILHDKKYTGSSNTVLIIWHVSKEDEGFYQASISQNNKTYISNSIELQVAEGNAFF